MKRTIRTTIAPFFLIVLVALFVLGTPAALGFGAGYTVGAQDGNDLAEQYGIQAVESQVLAERLALEADQYRAAAVEASETVVELVALREDDAALIQQLRDAAAPKRLPSVESVPHTSVRSIRRSIADVEKWRTLTARYFKANTDQALSVLSGESDGDPKATNGDCCGLMQIDRRVHAKAIAAKAREWGMKPDLYDPAFNIRFAAYMSARGTNWSSWTVQP